MLRKGNMARVALNVEGRGHPRGLDFSLWGPRRIERQFPWHGEEVLPAVTGRVEIISQYAVGVGCLDE